MRSRGFTLVELVMVIVLVGILAAVVAPRLDLRGFDSSAAAAELVGAIRYAQTMSMAHGGVETYAVRLEAGGYRVLRNGVATVDPFRNSGAYVSGWQGITLAPTGEISFDARGAPACTGFDCTASAQAISISRGGVGSQIVLQPVTGYVQ